MAMDITNSFESYSDKELNNLLLGKHVEIAVSTTQYIGVVTGFINAAQWDDPERKIMGIILNSGEYEISFSHLVRLTTIL